MTLRFELVNTRLKNPKMRAASHWIKTDRGGTVGYLSDPTITHTGSWNVKLYGAHVSTAPDFTAAKSTAESIYARLS